jgi:hypothetical protein
MKLVEAIRIARKTLFEDGKLIYTGKDMVGTDREKAEAYNLLAEYHDRIGELDSEEEKSVNGSSSL